MCVVDGWLVGFFGFGYFKRFGLWREGNGGREWKFREEGFREGRSGDEEVEDLFFRASFKF